MVDSLYDYDKGLRQMIDRVKRRADLSERKKRLILEYKDEMLANGLSKGRASRFTHYMVRLAEWLPCEFEEADVTAIKQVVSTIEASDYVPFSKMEHKLALRRFYKWLRGTDEYPAEVKWIPTRVKHSDRMKLPEDLLTEEDVRALMEAAYSSRDRAFVAVLYETGARVSELALLRLKHVQFDEYGAKLRMHGKTGSRRVRIISSVPTLTAWINAHPRKHDPEAPLWPTNRGTQPRYGTVATMLTALCRRAGVKKKVHAHLFRHSRATHLANHLTEAQMKEYFGWIQASRMAAVYVHLSGRDVDDALLKLHGVKKEERLDQDVKLKPKPCSRCRTENPCTNGFCSLCGLPLDEQAAGQLLQKDMERAKADEMLDAMLDDARFREQFLSRLRGVFSTPTSPSSSSNNDACSR